MSVINIKWSRYIPHKPTAKQRAFIFLPHEEALYGGAAGGGKSDSLLMIALQYFDCPGYKGIIFRRSLTDHKLPASILNRAKEWLQPFLESGEVRYVPGEHTFYSKEGGMLSFGYLDKEGSKERYQSAEFHTICFDEASQFKMDEILYLFSRMRRTADTQHIPLRFRLATNPGGRNHAGIKKRFKIDRDPDGEFRGHDLDRPFIQAKVPDNPHLDGKQYERQLDKLDPVTRDRLKSGDWSASEAALYKDDWFRHRYRIKGDFISLETETTRKTYHRDQLFVFGTTDVAGSEKTGLEGKVFFQNQEASWSVYSIWGMTHDFELLHLAQYRYQCTIPNFIHKAVEVTREWKPAVVLAESNSINLGFTQGCQARGIPISPVPSIADKIVRSTSAQLLAEEFHVWLPVYAEWLADWEDELFVWQGLKGEVDDQIDTLSLAGGYVAHKRYGSDMQPGMTGGRWTASPSFTAGLIPTQIAGGRYSGGLFPAKSRR